LIFLCDAQRCALPAVEFRQAQLPGGTRERHFDGANSKSHKLPKNAPTHTTAPTYVVGDRVHIVNCRDSDARCGAVLGGGVVDESPIYALLANSRLNPIDFLCSRDQFHEASQDLTSHAKSSPSSCPSPTHPPTCPNT